MLYVGANCFVLLWSGLIDHFEIMLNTYMYMCKYALSVYITQRCWSVVGKNVGRDFPFHVR